jgi:hypothetical protein
MAFTADHLRHAVCTSGDAARGIAAQQHDRGDTDEFSDTSCSRSKGIREGDEEI